MFNLFRKKAQSPQKHNNANVESDQINPTEIFTMIGPTIKSFWDEFIKGENLAVKVYYEYSIYKSRLNAKYSDIDFERKLKCHEFETSSICLTAGECMCLKLLGISNSFYLSVDYDANNAIAISPLEYEELVSELNEREIAYCIEIKDYINRNIKSIVEKVSYRRYGVNICKHTLPFNTTKCINYHTYLAEENYFDKNNYADWNRISNAPIFDYKTSPENPIVPISIKYIDPLILDYLCYGTISLPTLDMDRLLKYKVPSSGKTVLQVITDTFGEGIDIYIERAIVDMNCAAFRSFVRNGLQIQ